MSGNLGSGRGKDGSNGRFTLLEQLQQRSSPSPIHPNEPYFLKELLDDAINAIPLCEKAEYVTAMVRCPLDVILREADPAVFLEFEEHNVWAAAVRMVNYWKWRVRLFGNAMAYESILDIASDTMTTKAEDSTNFTPTTKNDDLRDEFRRLVDDRAMFVLPEKDTEGNFILFTQECFHLDLDTHPDGTFLVRVFFYNCIVMINRQRMRIENGMNSSMNNNMIKKACFATICILQRTPNHLDTINANSRDILRDAVPLRNVRLHLVFVPHVNQPTWNWLIQNVAVTVTTIANAFFKHTTVIMSHICPTNEKIIDVLLPFGTMTHDMLPTEIGGTFQLPTKNQPSNTISTSKDLSVGAGDADNLHGQRNVAIHLFQNSIDPIIQYNPQNQQHGYDQQQPIRTPGTHESNHVSWDDLIANVVEQSPVSVKYGYQNAIQHCFEEIRNNEANPSVFIEYEGGNVLAGVQRLLKYWSWRVLVFGEPLAYQSILQRQRIMEHSMNDSAIAMVAKLWNEFCTLVDSNGITIQPQTDADGNYIMVVDQSRFVSCEVHQEDGSRNNSSERTADSTKSLRLFLYNVTLVIQKMARKRNTTSQSPSVHATKASLVILNVIQSSTPCSTNIIRKNLISGEACSMLQDILPARLVRIHVLFVTAAEGMNQQASNTLEYNNRIRKEVPYVVLDVAKHLKQENEIVVIPHIGTPSDLVQQMIHYGITSEMMGQPFSTLSQSTTITMGEEIQTNNAIQNNYTYNNSMMMLERTPTYEEHVPNNVVLTNHHHNQQPSSHLTAIPLDLGTNATTSSSAISHDNHDTPGIAGSSTNLIPNRQLHAIVDYWRSRIDKLERKRKR